MNKTIQDLTLLDDIFMNAMFNDDNETLACVLRIILEKDDLKIIESKAQSFNQNLNGRSVRYDVKAKDDNNTYYDIEVQKLNSGAIAQRARYNVSLLNCELLKTGEDIIELPKVYVIFITESDVLNGNQPIYHINRRIIENAYDRFDDFEEFIYVNCAY